MTQITQVTKNEIFMYHDYTFMIFLRDALVSGAEIVGYAWAAGKARKCPKDAPVGTIKKDTCYHQILILTLIESYEGKD